MLEIYAVKHEEKIDGLKYLKLLSYVPEAKKNQIERFLRWGNAQQALIADVLTRSIIGKKLRLKNHEIIFEKNEHGKPFLKNSSDFHFNNSHAGAWIICAASDKEVGIDVEIVKPRTFDIAKRFFSQEEYEELMAKKEEERLDHFYSLWTLKESYLKAVGKGLSLPLNDFTISIRGEETVLKDASGNRLNTFSFRRYEIDKGYKLSVCAAGEIVCEKLVFRTLDEVIKTLHIDRIA